MADLLRPDSRIGSTLDPYGGRFIVHGAQPTTLEGGDPGTMAIIEFPDRGRAEAWYASAAYREITGLSLVLFLN